MTLEPQGAFVELDGLRVHYVRAGAGAPLLLLHGFTVGSSRLTYGPSIGPLSEHFDVIAPDLPGYGLSSAPRPVYKTADYVRFVCHFLDALGLGRANVVGFSKGGAIALGLALEQPERLHKLMLVSAFALDSQPRLPLLPYFAFPLVPYLALRTPWLAKAFWLSLRRAPLLLPLYLKLLIFGNPRAVNPQLLAEVREPLSRAGSEEAFMAWLRTELGLWHYRTDYSRRLSEVRTPTLLLHGTRDLVVPIRGARRASKLIPNAEFMAVRRCGHWLPREAPAAFVRAATRFFEAG